MGNLNYKSLQYPVIGAFLLIALGCQRPTGFSLESDSQTFYQNSNLFANKIDILWVVDNSGSMAASQRALADNFDSFIDRFKTRNLDFQMAVTTTDAYRAVFESNPEKARFRDGAGNSHSGYYILDQRNPNLHQNFLINILQGTSGNGDERAFQSMQTAMTSSLNTGFLRRGGFFAVIIISDEDDFSHSGAEARGGEYTYPGLHTVDSYVEFLKSITQSTTTDAFSVSAITIPDQTCLQRILDAGGVGQRIGVRYIDIVNKTRGVVGSLCERFSDTLSQISGRILELSTQFPLNRVPQPDTLRVTIDGILVPNSAVNGWTYSASANAIQFHGSYIPSQGARIVVDFTPGDIR